MHPSIFLYCNRVKKHVHIGRTVPKIVCLTTELCTPGAVCTINFEHCQNITLIENLAVLTLLLVPNVVPFSFLILIHTGNFHLDPV